MKYSFNEGKSEIKYEKVSQKKIRLTLILVADCKSASREKLESYKVVSYD